jgi:ribosomal protein S18 acetylase RimI-like enzyme
MDIPLGQRTDSMSTKTCFVVVQIRRAAAADARDIAELHVRSWQWAYRGQLPDEFLDRLSVEGRTSMWERQLAREDARVWVAENDAGSIIGFAHTGASRDDDAPPGTAELYAIYIDPAIVGTGVGRTLIVHALEDLRARGYRETTLWVLESNQRGRRFYGSGGWRPDGASKVETPSGVELEEVRYRLKL